MMIVRKPLNRPRRAKFAPFSHYKVRRGQTSTDLFWVVAIDKLGEVCYDLGVRIKVHSKLGRMMKRKELRIARPLVFGIFPQTGAINAVRRVKPGEYIYQYRAGCRPSSSSSCQAQKKNINFSGDLGTVLINIIH